MAEYIGELCANYRLIRLLGRGSFADVYLGKHVYLKTEVAVKVFCGYLEPETLNNFHAEISYLRYLEHPHIIGIHEVEIKGKIPFFVMDFAPGGTLRQRYPDGTLLPLSTVISYVQQIGAALDYAHAHKLAHRDLRPENLLFGRKNEILLSEFGVTLPLRNADMLSIQGIGGTLAYMAPEQIRGKPCAASDQYALAIMVYEWLAGQRPFRGGAAELCGQQLFVPPPSLADQLPAISPLVENVLFKALAKDPDARFANVSAFATALDLASQGKGATRPLVTLSQVPRMISDTDHAQEPAQKCLTYLPAQLTTLSDKRFLGIEIATLAFTEIGVGNYALAEEMFAEGERLYHQISERGALGRMLFAHGLALFFQGEFAQVRPLLDEALQVSRESGDEWVIACSLHIFGWLAYCQGNFEPATRLGQESVALFRKMGFPVQGLDALCIYACELAATGDLEQAQNLLTEAHALARKTHQAQATAQAFLIEGNLALRQNNPACARHSFEQSIASLQEKKQLDTRYHHIRAGSLEGLAEIALMQEQPAWAARLLGAAESVRITGPHYNPIGRDQSACTHVRETARVALGEECFTQAFREGLRLTPTQALAAQKPAALPNAKTHIAHIEQAKTGATVPANTNDHHNIRHATTDEWPLIENLTKRELEVLRLLAQGRSNAGIAEALGLSIVTINSYLRSVYNKLGVSSRTQAMRRALDEHILQ